MSRAVHRPFSVAREDLDSAAARALIAALDRELLQQYPEPGATHFRLDHHEVAPDRGVFLVARLGDLPVACGALRRITVEVVEIKRMYVDPAERGLGIGRQMLEALELEAGRLGARRMVLETGERQVAALSLYESSGFTRIPPFGEYVGSPLSVCLGKDVTPLQDGSAPGHPPG